MSSVNDKRTNLNTPGVKTTRTMVDDDILRTPDERTGLALRGKEPILFPKQRKELADSVKKSIDDFRNDG